MASLTVSWGDAGTGARPGQARSEEDEGVLRRVGQTDQDAVTGLETGTGEPTGDRLDAIPALAEGPGPIIRTGLDEGERRPVDCLGIQGPLLKAVAGEVEGGLVSG